MTHYHVVERHQFMPNRYYWAEPITITLTEDAAERAVQQYNKEMQEHERLHNRSDDFYSAGYYRCDDPSCDLTSAR